MRFWRGAVLAFACGLLALRGFSADESLAISLWDVSATLRAGGGHKDNLLLSDFNKESSAFSLAEAELFVFRAPVDEWEFTSFISGEDRRFWQSNSVDKEQLFIAAVDGKRKFLERWKAGLNLQYFYSDQVFDASIAETNLLRLAARSHRVSGGPSLQVELPGKRRIELSVGIVRQLFDLPLDDSWEVRPKLLVGQKYGYGSDVTLSAAIWERQYDRRGAPGAAPGSSTGETLRFSQAELEFGARHVWDPEKRWRSRFRAGVEFNEDNGSGYFDFRKYRFSKELSFTRGGFEGILEGKFLQYEYLTQTALDGRGRRRTEWVLGVRLRQEIAKRWSLFVKSEYEWVFARDAIESYRAGAVWGGVEWTVE